MLGMRLGNAYGSERSDSVIAWGDVVDDETTVGLGGEPIVEQETVLWQIIKVSPIF